ncbi:sulfatase-like hydrolase/transferase [Nocardia cyriacigeorgica]|uniref:Sulfatase-like hydrolase/transferase n=2 Tax=Nocardia cyriacigeorgica TaxID=135487 RepID=A0ABX0CRR9_9NOCA|nr:arylsulfatase [Nocardia cyriacigeorgica]NEW38109.1 sulfatase-like hydrolase/transferase [Nocardia cyriacigeorgica]NEW48508.1 sulfatase-like hydrolase/transferase [Nocardia cyriacigeorgica]NEW59185.1 sulfatase-like hydrolase/transferase [Nocardia cyriacigeorgica]
MVERKNDRREVLPIPDRQHLGLTTYDAKDPDTTFPPIEPLLPPAGAPNVLVVLLDDVGFGASSAFGGPANTPTAERLQRGGLTYNRFHTTALCAPTRAALLSGRNHHSVGMGMITETATSAPGSSGLRPNTKASLPMTLKLNGYSTAQFGKCHEVPPWQTSPIGPFDAWPTGGGGFEHFYGFIGGENNQYYPALYEGVTPVEPDKTPEQGYHLTEDLADHAIDWIRTQKSLAPDRPFFVYFAPGATHAPHHVPTEWSDKYAGRFADGWDAQREAILAEQKRRGIAPADTELTARPDAIPAWEDMDDTLKPVLERQIEVYAGFLEHTDFHVGRVIDTIEALGALDDTLIFYIIGDNGASAEGTVNGAFNEMANFNGLATIETPEFMAQVKEKLGTPEAYNHYSVGWAWAMCAPFQWTKQVASHWGGTRNGTVVHWPNGITSKGAVRSQFTHVIDVAATVLEAAGLPDPTFVNGVQQAPLEGQSMVYSFDEPDAPERHDLQYFEMAGNRGIYYKGWSAVTRHSTPWLPNEVLPALDDDVWELYDGSTDWSQARDLAAEQPERLAALQRLWLIEAVKYNVLPIDDRRFERLNPTIAGRPQVVTGNKQVLFPGMRRLSEHSVIDIKNRSFSVTAAIETPKEGPTNGVVIAQGGRFGGWAFYVRDGRVKFVYNLLGMTEWIIGATEDLPTGRHQIRASFAYDGGGLAKGGEVTLYVDGRAVGSGRIEQTQPMIFSADETTDIGDDFGMPVSGDYSGVSKFNGSIDVVQLDVGDDDHSHLIDPAEVARVATSRQ